MTVNTTSQVQFTLTDDMDDTKYDHPLTVKVKMHPEWAGVAATQDGNPIETTVVTYNSEDYALVKAVPDQGTVVLLPAGTTYYLDAAAAGPTFDGSFANPWQTLEQMQTFIYGLPDDGAGDRVLIAPGSYGAFVEGGLAGDGWSALQQTAPNRTDWLILQGQSPADKPEFSHIELRGVRDAYLEFNNLYVIDRLPHLYNACVTVRDAPNQVRLLNLLVESEEDATSQPNGLGIGNGVLSDVLVEGCEVRDVTTGIEPRGDNITIRNNHIHHVHSSAIKSNVGSNMLVEGNYIHDQVPLGGVQLDGAISGTFVYGESVTQDVTGVTGKVYEVYANYIIITPDNLKQEHGFVVGEAVRADLGDGVVDPLNDVTIIDWSHGSGLSIRTNGYTARNNHIHDYGTTAGIMVYGTSQAYSNMLFENNLVYDSMSRDVVFNDIGDNFVVRNNTFYGNAAAYFYSGYNGSGLYLYNNIIQELVLWDDTPLPNIVESKNVLRNIKTRNPSIDYYAQFPGGSTSLLIGYGNDAAFDALFTDAAGRDFTLAPGSAAIGFADPAEATAADILGVPRNPTTPSAGAYEYVSGGNIPPNADAGPDQNVTDTDGGGDEDVTLDGSASSDSDGTIVSYVWEENSSQIATGVSPVVTLAVNAHTIDLIVTDDDTDTDTDSVVIDVQAPAGPGAAFIVGNTSLGNGDTAVNSALAGLGYTVTIVNDDVATAADANGMTVVVISASVNGNLVQDTFRAVTVPVVTWEKDIYDDMDMTTSQGTQNKQTHVDIVDSGHAMAAGLSGTVEINTSKDNSNWGVPTANADIVATIAGNGSRPVLFGYEAAAIMANGYAAPSRRVGVFMDADSASKWTPDGQDLFEAAVTWAANVAPPPNQPPTADAGPDQNVTDIDDSGDEDVTLDGSASDDSDGTIVSYEWEESSVPIASGVSPIVTLSVAVHTIDLTVTDDDTDADTDSVVVTVNPYVNAPPTADAGPDQNVEDTDEGGDEDVTLDGSGSSDSDGTIVSYEWEEASIPIASGVSPLVTLNVAVHTIDLIVTDDDTDTDTDSVVITVTSPGANTPPTADAGPDQNVTDTDDGGDEDVTLDGSGSSDSDGTIVSYEWEEATVPIASGVSPLVTLSVAVHTIDLIVTDDDTDTDTDSVVITVNAAGPPSFSDDFNRSDRDLHGDNGWAGVVLGTGEAVIICNEARVRQQTSAEVSPQVAGAAYIRRDLAGDTLASGGVVTWGVRIPLAEFNPGGTMGGAVVLGATAGDWATGAAKGYAIGIDYTNNDRIMLASFDVAAGFGVFSVGAEVTSIIGSGSDSHKLYFSGGSARVEFNPGTSAWSLYFRNDPLVDPATLDAGDLVGTVVDTSNTSEALYYMGAYFRYNGNTTDQERYLAIDDYSVSGLGSAPPDNFAPTADAGLDQNVPDTDDNGSEDVTLDGSGSSDSDGTIVSYEWEENSSQIATGVSPVVTLDVNVHTIELIVTDDDTATGTDTVVITVEPYSAGEVLFVTGSGTLTAADQVVADMLTALSYTVTSIDDGVATAGDATGKSLVVISATVNGNAVGAEFRTVTVPAVTWEKDIMDDMDLTTDQGTDGRETDVDILDSGHAMAAGLSGTVTVYSPRETLTYGVPTVAADVVASVAGASSQATLFGYDTSDVMANGYVAPARRVGVFLDANSAEDLTTDGTSLIDAALSWALGL